ncbi:MAG TPA: condensation domain-containing protein, partial [Chlamydiales bacterium]|nr:condensation domain-containing protein [Chlamydiales bacterium]
MSTTCSTSLIAVHLACQSLLSFESDIAITGAINLRLFPFAVKEDPVDALGITTDKGACLAFDDKASGIVRGEGGGVLVLKRLSDAVRDLNPIYALIRGSATNNDGKSSSVGAPNPLAQAALLKTAWEKGKIDPRHIDYIEAHGTGTRIGDPIEIQGIGKAFAEFTNDKQFCAVGSVKTNIGHLTGGASGLASLIKTILALKNNLIPPSLHFQEPNSFIDFPNTPIFVASRALPWPVTSRPRLAGISAFGFNGSNCHVVLEEAPARAQQALLPPQKLPFLFSHRTLSGLKKQMQIHLDFFREKNNLRLEDISYTLMKGRNHYASQCLLTASSLDELIATMEQTLSEKELPLTSPPKTNFEELFKNLSPHLLSLPTYVFEPKRFWLEPKKWNDEDKIVQSLTHREPVILPVQEVLLNLFEEVLGMEKIAPTDNFFDLGGESLAGMEIIHAIHKRLDKKISYQDLFQYPRIIDLALFLENKGLTSFQSIARVERQEYNPLSYGQRRLWILHQMQDHPIAYNIYDTLHFETSLNLPAFKNALDQLVQRHSSLHTIFVQKEGEPQQKLIDPKPFPLYILEVSSLDDAKKEIEILRNTPFDLENGPLAKALLIRLSATSYLFFFMIHHIIADGWSIRIIIEELLTFYNQQTDLAPIKIDSIDFSHWQNTLFASEKFKALENYWLKEFAGSLPVCEIPGDKIRPAVFHFQGARKIFRLSQTEQLALTRMGHETGSTLFMVLLSSIYALINRYTGQTDLIIGSPVSGRSHPDLKPLIGFFVNTLAIRCSLNSQESFLTLLR